MGITTLDAKDDNLAMALGGLTRGVTPLEMASAYGTFANKGVHVKPTAIVKILDRNGNVLEDSSTLEKEETKTRVMSEREAYEMTTMLEGVIDHGTGRLPPSAVRQPARPGRRTTTKTPGSSATRRTSSRPSGSATIQEPQLRRHLRWHGPGRNLARLHVVGHVR